MFPFFALEVLPARSGVQIRRTLPPNFGTGTWLLTFWNGTRTSCAFFVIKVFGKGQITSLALKKKNLDTLIKYSMPFTLCNIKNQLGGGKSSPSILARGGRWLGAGPSQRLLPVAETCRLCVAKVAAAAFTVEASESKTLSCVP